MGGRKRGRETSVSCLYAPQSETKPTTQACTLTRDQTSDLSLCQMMPNQLSHMGQGCGICFLKIGIYYLKGKSKCSLLREKSLSCIRLFHVYFLPFKDSTDWIMEMYLG